MAVGYSRKSVQTPNGKVLEFLLAPGEFNFAFASIPGDGIALDPDGSIWVSDGGNSRLQHFDPDGIFLGSFGGFGIGPGLFFTPAFSTFDNRGRLFVVDNGTIEIKRYSGTPLHQDLSWTTGLVGPSCMVFSGGVLYVADQFANVILMYTPDGALLGSFGNGDPFWFPFGITADNAGNLYVSDSGPNVWKFDPQHNLLTSWVPAAGGIVDCVAAAQNGSIYVTTRAGEVLRTDQVGTPQPSWSVAGAVFDAVLADRASNIYAVDINLLQSVGQRVMKFSPDGVLLRQWGHFGVPQLVEQGAIR